jgi:Endonuclease NucS
MVEREMQELLWRYPERFLNEPLKQIAWEASPDVGRADLVFEDRHGRLLIIEVKHGKLPRGAIDQLLDYFGMMKQRFPNRPVELQARTQTQGRKTSKPARANVRLQASYRPYQVTEYTTRTQLTVARSQAASAGFRKQRMEQSVHEAHPRHSEQ